MRQNPQYRNKPNFQRYKKRRIRKLSYLKKKHNLHKRTATSNRGITQRLISWERNVDGKGQREIRGVTVQFKGRSEAVLK